MFYCAEPKTGYNREKIWWYNSRGDVSVLNNEQFYLAAMLPIKDAKWYQSGIN